MVSETRFREQTWESCKLPQSAVSKDNNSKQQIEHRVTDNTMLLPLHSFKSSFKMSFAEGSHKERVTHVI